VTTPFNLRHEVVGLLNIHHVGQLGDLLLAHAAESSELKLPLDTQLHGLQPVEPMASEVARAAKTLFGCSEAAAHDIACDELRHHPRRDLAIELIASLLGKDLPEQQPEAGDQTEPKPTRRPRAW
jgi:hypothetical protein